MYDLSLSLSLPFLFLDTNHDGVVTVMVELQSSFLSPPPYLLPSYTYIVMIIYTYNLYMYIRTSIPIYIYKNARVNECSHSEHFVTEALRVCPFLVAPLFKIRRERISFYRFTAM